MNRAFWSSLRLWILASWMASACWMLCASPAFALDALSAPAIDTSVFREDALRLIETTYGDWLLRCQEVVPLQKRFCNLVSSLHNSKGDMYGYFLLTTDKTGQPGVYMRVKSSLVVARPAVVSTSFNVKTKKGPTEVKYNVKVSPTLCNQTCDYVFPLDSQLVFALNEAKDVDISILVFESGDWRSGLMVRPEMLKLSGKQFKEALQASVQH